MAGPGSARLVAAVCVKSGRDKARFHQSLDTAVDGFTDRGVLRRGSAGPGESVQGKEFQHQGTTDDFRKIQRYEDT